MAAGKSDIFLFSFENWPTIQTTSVTRLGYNIFASNKNIMAETATPSQLRDAGNTEQQKNRIGLRTTLPGVRHRNFQLFFCGPPISIICTLFQDFSRGWLFLLFTGSYLLSCPLPS